MTRPTFDFSIADNFSALQQLRLAATPCLPLALRGPVKVEEDLLISLQLPNDSQQLSELFPSTWGQPIVQLTPDPRQDAWISHPPLRVGIVLSGGQAPGGHNVIAGVYDYLKKCNPNSQLFGFLNGPAGIFEHAYVEVTDTMMNRYRNIGGFDMIRSGRHKIETEEQKHMSIQVVNKLDLHGLVVVGGDDSNTNAAVLAEYFKTHECSTKVVGVPKTIDGDLKNEYVETSFGFDTAVKTYAEFIGNLAVDVATSGKYYHFVRLMGRAASNITLHCALLTRPNLTFIGEEVQEKNLCLKNLIDELVTMIVKRQSQGKDYGVVLVPEGLIEFIPEVGKLIQEINNIVAAGEFDLAKLTPSSASVFSSLPNSIKEQLLLDRDPHGNVQVSRIATERLLILMTKEKLASIGKADTFIPRSHFFGYEGRAGIPSVFDSDYCYALGYTAAGLVDNGLTGYMAVVRHLHKKTEDWMPGGCPLTLMMNIERRKGKDVPVIKKYLVKLNENPYLLFAQVRDVWKYEDMYASPGPIQFDGPCSRIPNFSIRTLTKEDLLPEREFGCEEKRSRQFFPKSEAYLSPLQKERLTARVPIPEILMDPQARLAPQTKHDFEDPLIEVALARSFPVQCSENKAMTYTIKKEKAPSDRRLRIGVLLNGQQAPGVANVLVGLWERLSAETLCGKLIGFQGGVSGLMATPPQYIEITRSDLSLTKNQGGFELLGREKESEMLIATNEGLAAARRVVIDLKLDGLVLIGGRYTLTDVAIVTEDFLRKQIPTKVIGIPVTQNNNINTSLLECSLGFDSASKCYSQLIGNLNTDGASCAKYWLFVRLMGADKSQIAIETALGTHPNVTLVSEAYAAGDKSLTDVVSDITDIVVNRASQGLKFGTVIIPEGLISSLPQFRQLISELKAFFSGLEPTRVLHVAQSLVKMDNVEDVLELSPWSQALLKTLPEYFRQQLVQPRSLGSLELTKVATEELLADMVATELRRREKSGQCSRFSFVPLCFYFGYQGRSSLPSNFDCSLGLAHGALAAVAVRSELTGYVTALRGLAADPETWIPVAYPATAFLRLQSDTDLYPHKVPLVPSDMIRLNAKAYLKLIASQQHWEREDHYANPGPIQFAGPASTTTNCILRAEHKRYLDMLARVRHCIGYVRQFTGTGASETALQVSAASLSVLHRLYQQETD